MYKYTGDRRSSLRLRYSVCCCSTGAFGIVELRTLVHMVNTTQMQQRVKHTMLITLRQKYIPYCCVHDNSTRAHSWRPQSALISHAFLDNTTSSCSSNHSSIAVMSRVTVVENSSSSVMIAAALFTRSIQ
eukprot:8437-Heterococcus_DN1.PRE.1